LPRDPQRMAIFRLARSHRRLFDSAKIYSINITFSAEAVNEAGRQVSAAKRAQERRYIRRWCSRGLRRVGVTPKIEPPRKWGGGLEWGPVTWAHEADEAGVDACRVSWQRPAPKAAGVAKAGGTTSRAS